MLADDGKLLYQLAEKRCVDYDTCPEINKGLFEDLAQGKQELMTGDCDAARETTKSITAQMYIPLIQGTMKYAYHADKLAGGEKALPILP